MNRISDDILMMKVAGLNLATGSFDKLKIGSLSDQLSVDGPTMLLFLRYFG